MSTDRNFSFCYVTLLTNRATAALSRAQEITHQKTQATIALGLINATRDRVCILTQPNNKAFGKNEESSRIKAARQSIIEAIDGLTEIAPAGKAMIRAAMNDLIDQLESVPDSSIINFSCAGHIPEFRKQFMEELNRTRLKNSGLNICVPLGYECPAYRVPPESAKNCHALLNCAEKRLGRSPTAIKELRELEEFDLNLPIWE